MCSSPFNWNKMASQISKYYFNGTLDCVLFKINSIIKFLALNRLEPKDHSEENRSVKGWHRCSWNRNPSLTFILRWYIEINTYIMKCAHLKVFSLMFWLLYTPCDNHPKDDMEHYINPESSLVPLSNHPCSLPYSNDHLLIFITKDLFCLLLDCI